MKTSPYGCVGGDEEPVAILVIDRLAVKRVSGAPPASVAVIATAHNDRKPVGARPLPMLHVGCCTRPSFGLTSSRGSEGRRNKWGFETRGKRGISINHEKRVVG